MNVAQHLELAQRLLPNKTALVFEGNKWSYRELNGLANRVANSLVGLGHSAGNRIGLFLPNSPAFVYCYFGIQKMGGIAVSINTMLKSAELRFILEDCGVACLITTQSLIESIDLTGIPELKQVILIEGAVKGSIGLDDLLAKSSPEANAANMHADAPAAIVYSSGTTGFPKGVTLSHNNILTNVSAKLRYCGMRSDDRAILFLPLFHCFGQNAILNSMIGARGTIVLQHKFDPERTIQSVKDDAITMFFGVPTIFTLLLQRAAIQDFRSVRYYFSAAATLPVEIAQRWQQNFGSVINEGYGLSETSPFACYNHITRHKLGSIGAPIEHVEMRIVDIDTGEPVQPGERGEIAIRGPNVMLGYWNRPDDTQQAIRQGWFHTGDIGTVDEEGYFYIVDRLKDMINIAGLKVYPAEVENILYQHPAVAEVAVYGIADPVMGERVAANIVLKPQQAATEDELTAFCRDSIAAFKVPSTIRLVDSIVKNPAGKVLKRLLRASG